MSAPGVLANVLAHSAQVAVVVVVGVVLARLTRLRAPSALLAWWRLLLLASILLPLLQPWPGPALRVSGGELDVREGATGAIAALPWARAVLFVLVTGTVWRLARLGLGLARLRGWRQAAVAAERRLDTDVIAAAVRDAGVTARLCLTDAVDVPATYGARRPVVLLPYRVADLPPDNQRDILAEAGPADTRATLTMRYILDKDKDKKD